MSFKSSTINASKVPGTLSNFPSFVAPSRIGITTLAQAQSSRFYADSGKVVEWAREVVSENEIHTKVPSLTSTVVNYCDYDGIRADYAVTDTYGRNAVWSGYRAVYHLDGLTDSTGNGYTLTNTNSVAFTGSGKLAGNTTADYGSTNTTKKLGISSNLGITGTGAVTVSGWVKQHAEITTSPGELMIFAHRTTSTADRFFQSSYQYNSGTRRLAAYFGTAQYYHNVSLGTNWFHYADERASGASPATKIYYNSSNVASGTGGTATTGQNIFGIGTEGGTYGLMRGLFDEVRVAGSILGANWLTTEYNNHEDESTFWGSWADVGGGQNSNFLMFM